MLLNEKMLKSSEVQAERKETPFPFDEELPFN